MTSDPQVWLDAFDEVHDQDTHPYIRLPKIDKTGGVWTPATESVTEVGGHVEAFVTRNWWRSSMDRYKKALRRYDADARVRGQNGSASTSTADE